MSFVRLIGTFCSVALCSVTLRSATLVTLCAAIVIPVAAQTVTIAPLFVVVDATTRTTSVTLVNTGTTPSEVSLSTLYGYPVTDNNGFMQLRTFDTVHDTTPTIAPWIQIFPQRLLLAPNERKVVRILVAPPAGLSDGEYWARLVVSARGGNVPVVGITDTTNVKVGIALEVRSVLPFFFRKGAANTGVRIGQVRTSIVGDSLVTRTPLTRTGNAAFMGSLRATLRDAAGKVAAQNLLPLGVFYSMEPRLPISIRNLKKGKYELTIEAVSNRPDVPQRMLIASAPARTSLPVVVP